jgi:hypothetical protein
MSSLIFGSLRRRTLDIRVTDTSMDRTKADALVVYILEDAKQLGYAASAVDEALDGATGRLAKRGEAKGKLDEVNIVHTLGRTLIELALSEARAEEAA